MVFFDYLDAAYRARLSSRTDRYGQQRLVIRDLDPRTGRPELERVFPQPEGPGKGAFAAIHPETAIGGVFNRIRIEHMDREGIDAQVLYGSMTLSFESHPRSRARGRLHAGLQQTTSPTTAARRRGAALPGRLHLAGRRRRGGAGGPPLRRGARHDRRPRPAERAGAASGGAGRVPGGAAAEARLSPRLPSRPRGGGRARRRASACTARPASTCRRASPSRSTPSSCRTSSATGTRCRWRSRLRLRGRVRPLPDAAHGLPRGRMRLGPGPGARVPRALGEAHPRLRSRDAACRGDEFATRAAARAGRRRRRSPSPAARSARRYDLYRRTSRETRVRRHRRVPVRAPRSWTTIRSTSSGAARSS